MLDHLGETVRTLRAHALRFSLTSLGIAWGALLLTFLSAQIGGLRAHYASELEETGPKLIFMGAGVLLDSRVGERGSHVLVLDPNDVTRLAELSTVERVTPLLQFWNQPVRQGRRTKLFVIRGLSSEAGEIRNLVAAEGRFLSPLDVARGARVAFIGAEVKERLFGRESALDRDIEIGSQPFRVIGVGVPKGDQLISGDDRDDLAIVVPYTTALRTLQQSTRIEQFIVAPRERTQGWRAIRQAREVTGLHRRFDPDQETALWSSDLWDVLKVIYGMFYALQAFFIVAGGVTVLVGAIGVMNIMLVVVAERTAEIGLRKALGARGRDIFAQFLLEALAIAGAASALGVAGGLALLRAAAAVFARGGIQIPTTPDPLTVIAVVATLLVATTISGVTPALRAARIPPAEALRSY